MDLAVHHAPGAFKGRGEVGLPTTKELLKSETMKNQQMVRTADRS